MKKIVTTLAIMASLTSIAKAETIETPIALHLSYSVPNQGEIAQKDIVVTEKTSATFDVAFETIQPIVSRYVSGFGFGAIAQSVDQAVSLDTRHYEMKIKFHQGNKFILEVQEISLGYGENYLGELRGQTLNLYQNSTIPALYNYKASRIIEVAPGQSFDMTPTLRADEYGNFFEIYPGHLMFQLTGG